MSSTKNNKLKFLLIGLVALGTARPDFVEAKNPPIILPDRGNSDKVFESKNYSQNKVDFRGKSFQSQSNKPEFIPIPSHIIEKQKSLPIQVYQKQRIEHQQKPQNYQKQVEKKYFYPQPKQHQEHVRQENVHYQSVHQEPVYREKEYQRPIYQQPVYQRPVYQQPVHQRPVYQQTIIQRPIYHQPIIQRPIYQQAVYQRPVYQQHDQRPIYKVLPPPTFIEYPYYGKGYYQEHEEKQRGKSFIHEVKKAQRQFDPKNILRREQREKEQKQEEQKQNQQRNWDEEKKKYYLEHYYKLHQYDNYQDRPLFWKRFDEDFYAFKRGGHSQQRSWHDNDRRQYYERRQPESNHERRQPESHHERYERHSHDDHDQTQGVHPNPLLPQPYPEVQCKTKNCQKSHNIRY